MGRTEIQTLDVPVGTLNLEDFCDCPNPCEECCGDVCGCPSPPNTLFGTIENVLGCACAEMGVEFAYNESTERWETGSLTLGSCGTSISFELFCSGSAPEDFRLAVAGCQSLTLLPETVECEPFQAVFVIGTTGSGCCSGGGLLPVMQLTITE